MSKPHVVFFNRSFYPDTAATGQLLTELCETLTETYGYRVTVIAGVPLLPAVAASARKSGFAVYTRETHRGIEIIRARGTAFPKVRFIGRVCNYLSYFFSAVYAGQFVDHPDAVIALTDPPIIGLAAYLLSLRHGVPLIMSYRDVFPEVAQLLEDFHSKSVSTALQRVNCFLVRRAARVIALGETMRARLIATKKSPPETTVVIPDWADCGEIVPAPRQNDFASRLGLVEKFVVLHSGNIGLSQGLDNVIETASLLRDNKDIEFVFIGSGVKRPQLENRARELGLSNVRFLPFQPKSDLTYSFATADVFLISLKKGLAGFIVPSKLYGILAAGRPFVGAVERESEVATIAERFGCGLVAEPGDARGMANQILRLYQDSNLRRSMGEHARSAAMFFDRGPQVLSYHHLFVELISTRRHSRVYAAVKRSFDVLLSGAGLLGSSPLWLCIALTIKLDDGGPIFYGQARVGRHGQHFKSWKFRSMIVDADRKFGPRQASEHDPRITRIGRFLRATAMDELPQLWNIFCGDMSFVGPRALLPHEAEVKGSGEVTSLDAVPGFRVRTQVRPGLTGIAQVYAARDIRRRHKFRLDALYVRNQSFWLDMKLIALSFWISFRGKWEYRGAKV